MIACTDAAIMKCLLCMCSDRYPALPVDIDVVFTDKPDRGLYSNPVVPIPHYIDISLRKHLSFPIIFAIFATRNPYAGSQSR